MVRNINRTNKYLSLKYVNCFRPDNYLSYGYRIKLQNIKNDDENQQFREVAKTVQDRIVYLFYNTIICYMSQVECLELQ